MKNKSCFLFISSLLLVISHNFGKSQLEIAGIENKIGREILEGTDDVAQEIAKRGVGELINPSLLGKIVIGVLILILVGTIIFNLLNK